MTQADPARLLAWTRSWQHQVYVSVVQDKAVTPGGLVGSREFVAPGACAGPVPVPAAGTMCRRAGGSRHDEP